MIIVIMKRSKPFHQIPRLHNSLVILHQAVFWAGGGGVVAVVVVTVGEISKIVRD